MENKKKYIFDNPQNVKRILYLLYACCTILFLLDFVIHRHVVHSWENLWGFYPIYGFVGCVILVVVATWMRTFLMRSEDYYENNDDNTNNKKSSDMNEENHRKLGDHNVDA